MMLTCDFALRCSDRRTLGFGCDPILKILGPILQIGNLISRVGSIFSYDHILRHIGLLEADEDKSGKYGPRELCSESYTPLYVPIVGGGLI